MITALKAWWARRQSAAEFRHVLRDPRTRREVFAAADRANLAHSALVGTIR